MGSLNFGFNRLNDSQLETNLQAIDSSMTDNDNFSVAAELTAAKAALAAYTTALAESKTGDRTKAAIKNQKKQEAIDAFKTMGRLVEAQAEGDVAMLISSGYTLRKTATPAGPVTASDINRLEFGVNSGCMCVGCVRIPAARLYGFQVQLDGTGEWITKTATRTKVTFEGLESGKLYWFRVIVYGTNGQEVIGSAISKMVA